MSSKTKILLLKKRELIYTLQKTARGNGDTASSDIQSVGRVQESQSSKHVVVIEERLPLAHANHVGYSFAEIFLNKHHLVDHFPRKKVSRETLFPRCAKRAAHRTSDLCRKANGKAILRGYAHHFRFGAIMESNDVFSCAVRRDLFIGYHRRMQRGFLTTKHLSDTAIARFASL